MFPVPSDRRSKIESQIKQGINRVYNEYKKGAEPSRTDSDDDDDQALDIEPEEAPIEEEPVGDEMDLGAGSLDAELDDVSDELLDLDDADDLDE
jgi:hypothetical protein